MPDESQASNKINKYNIIFSFLQLYYKINYTREKIKNNETQKQTSVNLR